MANMYLGFGAAVFSMVCIVASFYHYFTNCESSGKRFPIHFGLSGEPDNWSENRHALKLYPGFTLCFGCMTVILAVCLPFWAAVGVVLCMGSSLVTMCVVQYYAVLISDGVLTKIPSLQYYSCLLAILVSTVLCVVLSLVFSSPADSSSPTS